MQTSKGRSVGAHNTKGFFLMEGRDFGRASTEELNPVPHAIGAYRKLLGWVGEILLVDTEASPHCAML